MILFAILVLDEHAHRKKQEPLARVSLHGGRERWAWARGKRRERSAMRTEGADIVLVGDDNKVVLAVMVVADVVVRHPGNVARVGREEGARAADDDNKADRSQGERKWQKTTWKRKNWRKPQKLKKWRNRKWRKK